MFDHNLVDKRQYVSDTTGDDPNNTDLLLEGFQKCEPEKRLYRGSVDSFYWSRAGSRSNSIHNGGGYSLFNNDGGQLTPYRSSPVDMPISPYASNFEITPLDLAKDNIAVPIPSKLAGGKQGQNGSIEVEKEVPHRKRSDSSSDDYSDSGKKEGGILNELIERFLEEEQISKEEWDSLRKEEQTVLNCLMKRKLGIDIQEYIKCKGALKEINVKCKRLEENYKMVFKGALKYLSATFKEKKGKKKSKAEDIAFYQFYFGQVANDSNPLEAFFHPNKKLKASCAKNAPNNQKTMNSTYLENLLSSERFRQGLETYLTVDYIKGYKMRRRKKIDNFIEKLKKDNFFNNNLEKLSSYLENNPKCKLPWSNKELMAAKTCVLQLIKVKKDE